ncbi:Txe/YoeB family addiction module toxin [Anaerorhabdus furcosa]|uniref:Endoribonuclease YoeB n=1 Tax=Anaerorhabdus furcosa TaxID=118967 RepID=A0A1T4M336_9FIRM|nr:Txe/YoeB family addiction module toxin [Anaerorhabdus furcosa]SJZ61341.1 toxin-antitoxin system, toxin component, Txe/YoeB family [Anaerorhabdus furcosa]
MYELYFTRRAEKDKKLLKDASLDKKTRALLDLIAINPYENPPRYEKLAGDLKGYYSRRINAQHRLDYKVDDEQRVIKILSMWSHYE